MTPVTKPPPDRATRIRRMGGLMAIGAVLLVAVFLWMRAVIFPLEFAPIALEHNLSICASVLVPLALGMLLASGASLAVLHFGRARSMFVGVICCASLIAIAIWLVPQIEPRFEREGARIIYTVYKTYGASPVLSAPLAVYGIPVTVCGPLSAVGLLPFIALPLLLMWSRRAHGEEELPDAPD